MHLLIYGFTMFSMFFGSGNLVFPLQLGAEVEGAWLAGFTGLFITGILLPFLGLIVIKLHKGDYRVFFAEGGVLASKILPFFTLSLLGSFGVLPRCITVAHGGIGYVLPEISLTVFSFVFAGISYFICLKERWIVAILGKVLTPLLLVFLLFLIGKALFYTPHFMPAPLSFQKSFVTGFFRGYETMDLLAAFFFSSVIFKQIEQRFGRLHDEKSLFKTAMKASLIGAGLLMLVYISFVYMGAAFKPVATGVSPELILPTISFYLLGEKAGLVLSVIIILSCLTTTIALNTIYARYLTTAFKLSEKSFPLILLLTTAIAVLFSQLDFKGISAFLGPLLEIVYPGLIVLTVLSLMTRQYILQKKIVFYTVTLIAALYKFL
ncbi:MAG: branched-chain amino acid transport system II carrier protein [Nitrosopumilus sp.]|nr:branched-chain amino acid transport system II carrier protein [Nitrosopumilus sp.]